MHLAGGGEGAAVFSSWKTWNFAIFKLCSTVYHDLWGVKGSLSGYHKSLKHTFKIFLEKIKILIFQWILQQFCWGSNPQNALGWGGPAVFSSWKTWNFAIFTLCSMVYHDRGGVKGPLSGYHESFKQTFKMFLEKIKILIFQWILQQFCWGTTFKLYLVKGGQTFSQTPK